MVNGLGRRIAEARGKAKLSQRELARRIGVSQPAVAQWETGRDKKTGLPLLPTLGHLQKVADALGVRMEQLVATPRRKRAA